MLFQDSSAPGYNNYGQYGFGGYPGFGAAGAAGAQPGAVGTTSPAAPAADGSAAAPGQGQWSAAQAAYYQNYWSELHIFIGV